MSHPVYVYLGEVLGRYGFSHDHPFSQQRLPAFEAALQRQGLLERVQVRDPVTVEREVLARFHHDSYIQTVQDAADQGLAYLDNGDTPVFPDIYQVSATVVGSVLDAARRIMEGECRRAFIPIAGLHHAQRHRAAGFCVFNDCGVVIESLRKEYGVHKIAYVDIDAHHGDGVFYAFEDDPELIFVDFHEDGRFIYPGTGHRNETGHGPAQGTKLNIPMAPQSNDQDFFRFWDAAEQFLAQAKPEFILLQCGADSLAGDPLAHLAFSAEAHRHAARRLCALADECCQGRILGVGGGGYNLDNIGVAWSAVVDEFQAG